MKKKLSLLLALLMLLSVLTACGDKSAAESEPTEAPTAAPTATPEATATPEPTEAPTAEPTATPAPTAAPTPECSINITKHPNSDPGIIEGNTEIFIARSDNARLVSWQFAPADEHIIYTDTELQKDYPVLVQKIDMETVWIVSVPLSMDGFKIRAVFENETGTAYTNWATMHVIGFFTQIPAKYTFMSGAGGWSTELTLSPDGSFKGYYHDSEAIGPNGETGYLYESTFEGKFGKVGRIENNVYTMELLSLTQSGTVGTKTVDENGITHEITAPYGFDKASVFHIYTPDTPITALAGEYLPWAHLDGGAAGNYGTYGLYNYYGQQGFVADPIQ